MEGFIPFLHITTRVAGRERDGLLMDKGGTAYPHFAILDRDGELLAKIYEPHNVASFKEVAERVSRLDRLTSKAAAGDKGAHFEAAILRCDLGQITYGELEEIVEPLAELSVAQKAALRRQEANEELETLQALARSSRDAKVREGVKEDILALFDEGAYPTRSDLRLWFWYQVAVRSVGREDIETLERALAEYKPLAKGFARYEESVQAFETKLAALIEKKGGKRPPCAEGE
ncbi:MAG: hypothetical protein ACYTGV_08255 [Planctomycetota bacterium]|jgi:hypothetical protein